VREAGHARLAAAEREHRSMTGQALHIFEQWLAQQERERQEEPEQREDRPPG
jgi:hypothetical protein